MIEFPLLFQQWLLSVANPSQENSNYLHFTGKVTFAILLWFVCWLKLQWLAALNLGRYNLVRHGGDAGQSLLASYLNFLHIHNKQEYRKFYQQDLSIISCICFTKWPPVISTQLQETPLPVASSCWFALLAQFLKEAVLNCFLSPMTKPHTPLKFLYCAYQFIVFHFVIMRDEFFNITTKNTQEIAQCASNWLKLLHNMRTQ